MSNPLKKIFLLFYSVTIAFFFTACDSNRHIRDLRSYVEKLKESIIQNRKKVSAYPIKQPIVTTYHASSSRMPFETKEITSNGAGNSPLQAYSLSTLRFVGSIEENNQSWAVIQTPDHKIYQIKIGDIIGNQYGTVIKISTNRLEVMEKVTDDDNQSTQRIVTLQLKESADDKK